MFDLTKANDIFRDSDIILTIRPGIDDEKFKLCLDMLEKAGMEVHAYSDRGDHRQYLLVPDRAELQERIHESCRNSMGTIFGDKLKQLAGTVPGEPVVRGHLVEPGQWEASKK